MDLVCGKGDSQKIKIGCVAKAKQPGTVELWRGYSARMTDTCVGTGDNYCHDGIGHDEQLGWVWTDAADDRIQTYSAYSGRMGDQCYGVQGLACHGEVPQPTGNWIYPPSKC
jgi:hypothetical protein